MKGKLQNPLTDPINARIQKLINYLIHPILEFSIVFMSPQRNADNKACIVLELSGGPNVGDKDPVSSVLKALSYCQSAVNRLLSADPHEGNRRQAARKEFRKSHRHFCVIDATRS